MLMELDLCCKVHDKKDTVGCVKVPVALGRSRRCKDIDQSIEFWNTRILAAGLSSSDAQIPSRPDQVSQHKNYDEYKFTVRS